MKISCRASTDAMTSNAIFSSFRERFCKVAEGTLGMNRTDTLSDLEQKLSLEELFRMSLFFCDT